MTGAGDRLTTADPNIGRAGDDAANSGLIDNAQIAAPQGEIDGLGSGGIEMDALESSERANRSAFDAGMCKIKLHNFVAWYGTGVRHANGDCDGGLRGDLCLAYFRVGIIE